MYSPKAVRYLRRERVYHVRGLVHVQIQSGERVLSRERGGYL